MAADDPTVTHYVSGPPPLPSRAGKYRIVGQIGRGGMGVVYRGVDDSLGRSVALKFIPEWGADSNSVQRFLREARALSALDHVNIGTIFGVEETEERRPFIVMAFYEGQNLGERMADQAHPLSCGEALSIAIQAARGLAEAHSRGVIHRDIKPSNILITRQGVVKIVDFGLASMSDSEQLTMAGERMGTPAYMSPEQAVGQPVDQRSDIWSLGVVLLEMLTNQRAFQSDSVPGTLYKVVHGEVPMLYDLQQPFRSLLAKALEKVPGKRYQNVNDFLLAMEAVQPGSAAIRRGASASWSSRTGILLRSARRQFRYGLAAAVLLAVIAVGAIYFGKIPKKSATSANGGSTVAGTPQSGGVSERYLQGVELMKRWDKEGNLDRAVSLLADATKSDPSFALGFARLAEAQRLRYMLSRDKTVLEAANKAAEEAMRLNPELAPVQVAWGRVQAARGNSDLAMASFERAVRIDGNDADAQLAIARQYERLGRLTDAEAAFKKAGSLDPDGIAVHDFYANFLFHQDRYAEAIREWQTVVQIAPDDAPAYVNLGAALNESGRMAESISAYQRALQLKPTDMAYSNLGTAYSKTGRYPEAASAYRKALDLADNNSMVWGNLAFVYSWMNGMDAQTGQSFARAIELAERSRKDDPRDPFIHRDLAQYYAKTGNSKLARQRIETALVLSPKGPEILADAAEVYELLGERTTALAYARKALALGYARQRFQENPDLAKLLPALK